MKRRLTAEPGTKMGAYTWHLIETLEWDDGSTTVTTLGRIFSKRAALRLCLSAEIEYLLNDVFEGTPCRFDHHGHCQEHDWITTDSPCPQRRIKEMLEKINALQV